MGEERPVGGGVCGGVEGEVVEGDGGGGDGADGDAG